LGVLLIGVLAGAVVERDPLLKLVAGKTSAPIVPNTGGKASTSPSASVASSVTATATVTTTAAPILAQIPNVTCMTAAVAQQAIEDAGFRFAGNFVANAAYASGVVFKTQPVPGQAPQGTEVTAFISTGPPAGIVGRNQCLNIIRVLPPGILNLLTPTPTP
jgi:hypothetical protein